MYGQWVNGLKLFGFGAALTLAVFCLMDLSPRFYGPIEFMAGHREFAPWFSGFATTTGVVVALMNAHLKELSDDRRAGAAISRAERALAESACSIVNGSHLACVMLIKYFLNDDWIDWAVNIDKTISPLIEVSRTSAGRIPAYQLPSKAIQRWYRIDTFLSHVSIDMRDVLVAIEDRDGDKALSARNALLRDCAMIVGCADNLAKILKVDVEWDFGTMEPFDAKAVVEAALGPPIPGT